MKKKQLIIITILIIILQIFLCNPVNAVQQSLTDGGGGGTSPAQQVDTPDQIFENADSFLGLGENQTSIDESKLRETEKVVYNLLLGIGIVVAVIVGVILGIKYMTGSVDAKAELKQALIGYVIGCGVIFGAFGIWSLAINVLSEM